MKRLNIGDPVKLTGSFLRSTGQIVGGEGQSTWIIVACDCALCKSDRFVAVNEPSYDDPQRPRHMAVGNLRHAHRPSALDDHVSSSEREKYSLNR